jgi:hypothetical protein
MRTQRNLPGLAAGLAMLFWSLQGAAQMPEFPMGGFPFGGDMSPEKTMAMTPEQREAAIEEMMVKFGARIGIDEAEMRAATPEQREELLRSGAEAMQKRMEENLEKRLGRPIAELKDMSEDELRALVLARQTAAPETPRDAEPKLFPAPPGGFPDGSEPLPLAEGQVAKLSLAEPIGREMLLVVADAARQEILWRDTRVPPFEETLPLPQFSSALSTLVIEFIDPETRRVLRRFRPVAGSQ